MKGDLPHVWMPALRVGTGADVFTERLADGLRRAGATVTVDWFDRRLELIPDHLRYLAKPPPGADVIHANAAYAFAFARFDLPLVVTEHHYVLDPAYAPFKSVAQAIYHRIGLRRHLHRSFRCADVLTTCSQFTARAIRHAWPDADVRVVGLWADYAQFSPEPNQPDESNAAFRVFFVGNGSRRKGGDLLPRVARDLGSAFRIIATSGLRDISQASGLSNLHALGRLSSDDLVRTYRECDVVLVPSRYEGFGYAALEAMACGKPVVGFSCGATDEVVSDGETAFLVPVDDVDGLTLRIRQLAADKALRHRMGAAGRDRATTIFSEKAGVDGYLSIYGDAIRRRNST